MLKSIRFKFQDRFFRRPILLFFLGIATQVSWSQTSNILHFADLADQCLSQLPDTPKKFEIIDTPRPSYLLSKAFARWQTESRTVYLPSDSTQTTTRLAKLRLNVKAQTVQYIPESRANLTRKLTLVLDMQLTKADGELVFQQLCVKENTPDVIPRKDLSKVETPGFPEATSPLPPVPERKWIKPVLISTALGTLGYLLYSVRSGND